MSTRFPSKDIAKKFKYLASSDDTALASSIVVPAGIYGVIYKLWVCIGVASEADLEALPAMATITAGVGASTVFYSIIHPYVEHTDAHGTNPQEHRWVDLGPWFYDFGPDGLYSGVKGEDIAITVGAMGSGVKSYVNYLYSGD